jgi:2-polyprenyl-3-methyl-5-hydroxy-6-metoxy-1,4-benzoquinol methylase
VDDQAAQGEAADDHAAIVRHYESTDEENRINSGFGELELLRTREILRRHLPPAPAEVLDVGGATGVHASWLAADGYRVHIVDLTPRHVEKARADLAPLGVTAELGDARSLGAADRSFDAVLLLGPLYHLIDRADRVLALTEARRVVRPGGIVVVAAINRFASLFDGLRREFLFEPAFRAIVERDLADGCHRNDDNREGWFTTAYFHRPDELDAEIAAAGLRLVELVGVEGIAHWLRPLGERWASDAGRETILFAARALEAEPSLLGLSPHLIAVARAADSLP